MSHLFYYLQVADLNMLRAETHKFESHYIDNLVGKINDNDEVVYIIYGNSIDVKQ